MIYPFSSNCLLSKRESRVVVCDLDDPVLSRSQLWSTACIAANQGSFTHTPRGPNPGDPDPWGSNTVKRIANWVTVEYWQIWPSWGLIMITATRSGNFRRLIWSGHPSNSDVGFDWIAHASSGPPIGWSGMRWTKFFSIWWIGLNSSSARD